MLAETKASFKVTPADQQGWFLDQHALMRLGVLTKVFRKKSYEQANVFMSSMDDRPTKICLESYVPWMDSFLDHKNLNLLCPHTVVDFVLIDESILGALERTFAVNGNPLGFLIPEEARFRVTSNIAQDLELFKKYKRSVNLFLNAGEFWRTLLTTLCSFIVPIHSVDASVRAGGVGFSSNRARGTIFLSVPSDENFWHLNLAINIAHELGHQALMIYQGADPILSGDPMRPVYSIIRKTHRPAILSFHAIVATAHMYCFVVDLLDNPFLSVDEIAFLKGEKLEYWNQLSLGVDIFSKSEFTEIGEKFFSEFKALTLRNSEVSRV